MRRWRIAGIKPKSADKPGSVTAPARYGRHSSRRAVTGALDRLEAFASLDGAAFYGLPANRDSVTLVRDAWNVPASFAFGDDRIVPLRAGETLRWRVAD